MFNTMKTQNFGVEIELTGITRKQAAKIIAIYFGTESHYAGTHYDTYTATDHKGRTWKVMSDSSIVTERKARYGTTSADNKYACEVVTPILQYEDIEDLQNVVRVLRHAGAIANNSCGIHVHVDGANHTPESLTCLMNFAIGRQDLLYEALEIGDRANHWCKKMNAELLKAMKNDPNKTMDSLERIWYSSVNDGYNGGINHCHYNSSRYHGINLHAFFTKGTVEFRLFNGTTHAGKIKSYVQLCLAMSAWSIECPSTKLHFRSCANDTPAQKEILMTGVLAKRLGLNGAEFKTCRHHLTEVFRAKAAAEVA